MANDTQITIAGNLTADPDLRFTPNGVAVANFTIASTPSHFDKQKNEFVDEETTFMRCNVWREFAENVTETLKRGTRVVAQGRLKSRSFEDKEGNKRTVMELEVDEIGPSLRRATAVVTKNPPKGGGFGGHPADREQHSSGWGANPQQEQSQQTAQNDPWATNPNQTGDDQPPF